MVFIVNSRTVRGECYVQFTLKPPTYKSSYCLNRTQLDCLVSRSVSVVILRLHTEAATGGVL